MMLRCAIALIAGVAAIRVAAAAPPVTNPEAPPPGPALAELWKKAEREIEAGAPKSEPARMLLTVRRDEKLAPGVGWYDPARRRYDWKWLAARYDRDGDGKITREEFADRPGIFRVLDRDGDGMITATDVDWSEQSPWVKADAQALKLFREIDADGNGRIDDAEWAAFLKKKSGDKGYLNTADIRSMFGDEREPNRQKRVSKEVWTNSLYAGDLGSAFEGPRVDAMAPDFTLPRHHGKGSITLSEFRGSKPVVLIFGSFT